MGVSSTRRETGGESGQEVDGECEARMRAAQREAIVAEDRWETGQTEV